MDQDSPVIMQPIVNLHIQEARTVQSSLWIIRKGKQEWKSFPSSFGSWQALHLRNKGPIDSVNLVLHHFTFPLEAAWNVIEHEGDLEPSPRLTIPTMFQNLVDPVGIGRL